MVPEDWPIALLMCPACRGPLQPHGPLDPNSLRCAACGASYPVKCGIFRFVQEEGYTSSFGRQWTRHDVVRPAEDLSVFKAKTGVAPEELRGLDVLDAGCGGGRYSRLVAAAGARVIGIDRSRAVDKAASLCRNYPNAAFAQADLFSLPFKDEVFDFVFSIGVIHHTASPVRAFRELARVVKPGGRLAIWVYRKNTPVQERLNELARSWTRRLPDRTLLNLCHGLALVGGVPLIRVTLNKILNFSNHPDFELRVCDNYDWYACEYQFHHTEEEVRQWFESAGFEDITFLPPMKSGRLYDWAYRHNLIPGSGVNVVATKVTRMLTPAARNDRSGRQEGQSEEVPTHREGR